MEKKTIALRLLELRQEHNLSQKELAGNLHISRSSYSYYESGSRTPDIYMLLEIAAFYHITLDELVTGILPASAQKKQSMEENISSRMLHHMKAKHIPIDDLLNMNKADFDFLKRYHALTAENQAELQYIMNYKLKNQD